MLRGLKDNFECGGSRRAHGRRRRGGPDRGPGRSKPDLIVLDIMLPKINGYEVCRLVREQKLDMPIIMLTAKGQEIGHRPGPEPRRRRLRDQAVQHQGAAGPGRALPRRRRAGEGRILSASATSRWTAPRGACCAHRAAKCLTPKEFDLLELLASPGPAAALTREEILNAASGAQRLLSPGAASTAASTRCGSKIEADPSGPPTSPSARSATASSRI